MTGPGKKQLIRGVGFLGVAILVLNSMIGAGIFALPTEIAATAGKLSPWLFLIVGVLVLTIVLSFAELSSYFKSSGGPVLYTRTAFGPLVGFSTGWMLYISRVSALAENATVIPMFLGSSWPALAEGAGRAAVICLVCIGLRAGGGEEGVDPGDGRPRRRGDRQLEQQRAGQDQEEEAPEQQAEGVGTGGSELAHGRGTGRSAAVYTREMSGAPERLPPYGCARYGPPR
jgi:hypothetical protein